MQSAQIFPEKTKTMRSIRRIVRLNKESENRTDEKRLHLRALYLSLVRHVCGEKTSSTFSTLSMGVSLEGPNRHGDIYVGWLNRKQQKKLNGFSRTQIMF